MALFHPGSWFGLPDFGITERLTGNKTAQGGSDLFRNPTPSRTVTPTPVPTPNPNRPVTNALGPGGAFPIAGGIPNNSIGVQQGGSVSTPVTSQGTSLLQSYPEQPSFDETPFNEIIAGIDRLGDVFRGDYETATSGIQQRSTQELGNLETQKQEGLQNLSTYQTQADQDAQQNIDEQRRQYAEVQQGLQGRYGGSTGTGAFVSELAGRQSLRNIGGFRQALQNEYSKVNQQRISLQQAYERERTTVTSRTEQLMQEAKSELQNSLAQLQVQKGQTLSAKSQSKVELLSNYQNQVKQIEQYNISYLRDLEAKKQEVQNTLQSKAYSLQYNAMNKAIGFWEEAMSRGALTPSGMRSVESQYGLPEGSLQAPTGIISEKDRLQSTGGISDDELDDLAS